jgi:hypothetical protein
MPWSGPRGYQRVRPWDVIPSLTHGGLPLKGIAQVEANGGEGREAFCHPTSATACFDAQLGAQTRRGYGLGIANGQKPTAGGDRWFSGAHSTWEHALHRSGSFILQTWRRSYFGRWSPLHLFVVVAGAVDAHVDARGGATLDPARRVTGGGPAPQELPEDVHLKPPRLVERLGSLLGLAEDPSMRSQTARHRGRCSSRSFSLRPRPPAKYQPR